ncbi:MAG: cytochrome c oxidase accessory protein CcoG [Nannocystaceae bacterium]|nr:cytochrome c oxidase accessory protein CcoG [Nannocystaceae bacterium]
MTQPQGREDHAPALLAPEEHVLSTLEHDGSRRWLKPKLSKGTFWHRRRVVAYLLIALYALLPHLSIAGRPMMLLDVAHRRFSILGYVFLPTDTLLLALFMVGVLLTGVLATALIGRVWCGWACPHTVYMEYLFRPIERFFEGTSGRGGVARRKPSGLRQLGKYITYFLISSHLSNTFLAYFVGASVVNDWVFGSPLEHPAGFILVATVTAAMMFHFSYFREQLCIIACPYGRLQSALLDDHSRIVAYDLKRGEPRGKRRKSLPVTGQAPMGDCVDCKLCVTTCPTGIDIRKGLQMECVNCTQCMDACDAVMRKLDRAPGLIRYSSQAADAGEPSKFLRPRTIIYPAIILVITGLFAYVLGTKSDFDAVLLRSKGQPFSVLEDGSIRNALKIKLTNRADEEETLRVELGPDASEGTLVEPLEVTLAAGEMKTFTILSVAPAVEFLKHRGQLQITLLVSSTSGDTSNIEGQLLGPDTQLPAALRPVVPPVRKPQP